MYYLKVLDRNNKKQICEIAISTYVYNYLADELSQIPQNKKEALNYYICFSGILQKPDTLLLHFLYQMWSSHRVSVIQPSW